MTNLCDHCKKTLGRQWYVYEDKKYHAHCFTPCSTCGRILSRGSRTYEDGRHICRYCYKTAVHHSWTVNKCKRQVLKQLTDVGFKHIPLNVPLSLASQPELTNKSCAVNTRGMALFQKEFKDHKVHAIKHHIYILYGVPKIEFQGILAHELIHVWQNENNFKLSPMHTEGLCNLASYWIYKEDGSDLAKILMDNLVNSKDRVYGNGFRIMLARWKKLGWKKFVEEILTQKEGIEKSLWRKTFG